MLSNTNSPLLFSLVSPNLNIKTNLFTSSDSTHKRTSSTKSITFNNLKSPKSVTYKSYNNTPNTFDFENNNPNNGNLLLDSIEIPVSKISRTCSVCSVCSPTTNISSSKKNSLPLSISKTELNELIELQVLEKLNAHEPRAFKSLAAENLLYKTQTNFIKEVVDEHMTEKIHPTIENKFTSFDELNFTDISMKLNKIETLIEKHSDDINNQKVMIENLTTEIHAKVSPKRSLLYFWILVALFSIIMCYALTRPVVSRPYY